MTITEINYSTIIASPLDQFEIRNLLSFNAQILGNFNLSITNIGLYLIIGVFIALTFNILATNYNKIGSNNWSIGNESLYATIHSIVVNQINDKKGQIYFPFIYSLFVFILVNNLIGMVQRCLYKKLFSIYTSTNQKVSFSSTSNSEPKALHPNFITGFVDGEDCFHISIYRDNKTITG
jgi:F0F1-type ATP synthase membrane subunit a